MTKYDALSRRWPAVKPWEWADAPAAWVSYGVARIDLDARMAASRTDR